MECVGCGDRSGHRGGAVLFPPRQDGDADPVACLFGPPPGLPKALDSISTHFVEIYTRLGASHLSIILVVIHRCPSGRRPSRPASSLPKGVHSWPMQVLPRLMPRRSMRVARLPCRFARRRSGGITARYPAAIPPPRRTRQTPGWTPPSALASAACSGRRPPLP